MKVNNWAQMVIRKFGIYLLFGLIVVTAGWLLFSQTSGNDPGLPQVSFLAGLPDYGGYEQALPPADIQFPRDYGPHPDFQTEWWYYTGNLSTVDNRRFGYQLTIFRRALLPPQLRSIRASEWATDQVYLAHFALTDGLGNQHIAFERIGRGAAELAGSQSDPYRVWLENWEIRQVSPGVYRMRAAEGDYSLDLTLVDEKGPVLHGVQGYSQKGADPGNASYYFSQTRLHTQGTLRLGEQEYQVTGLSWKDHEYSTSALDENQIGWDWFALQFDDGTELKLFHIRQQDGAPSPYSAGSFINQKGEVTPLTLAEFSITPLDTWTSPESQAVYPSKWEIAVPSLDIEIMVEPLVLNQELVVSYVYWEGAVQVNGKRGEATITGFGYVELTGYAHSMAGEF
jgi:predicted secreted hydrolase